jgi:hypothetical protein
LCPEAMAVYIFNNVLPVYVAKMRRAVRKQTGCYCGCPSRPRGDWGLCGDCSSDSAEADGFLQQLLKLL